ncbi:TonB-dependent receptor plug domain-containing protein [Synergistes jonesii]|uniref:TonB-dependent receptor plug domain-containing protein n=1 Tax=Synergistes jonesii TaxID=2754 RepID=UPI00248D5368|nr:TonB-dependent receptor [Synergistes jonesii]
MQKKMHLVLLLLLSFAPLTAPPPRICAAEEPVRLPEERVTADAEEEDKLLLSPGTVSVIKPQEMKGEQKNLPELLKQVPGLHVIELRGRGAYTTVSVRGSTPAQVAVYVDGVLMNLGSEAAVDLSTIPVENVERIEVYRGYIPARFGGASMGGVINIITKKPDGKGGGTLLIGGGSYGRFRAGAAYSAKLGDGALFVGVTRDQTNGRFLYPNDNNTPYDVTDDYRAKRQNNSYQNSDSLVKWQNENWTIEGAWKRNDRDLPYGAPGNDKPWSVPGPKQLTDQESFSAVRRQKLGALDLGVRLEYLHQSKRYDDDGGDNVIGLYGSTYRHNRYVTDRYGVAIDGSLPAGDAHLVEFLWNWYDETLRTKGDVINYFAGIEKHTRYAWNGQIQDTISIGAKDKFWLTPVIRWNHADGRTEFSGGAALNYKFDEHWSAKVTYGGYNRAPNMYELYGDGAFVIPNPLLDWEEGTQWDAGVTWKGDIFKGKSEITLTYFGSHVDNLIEYFVVNPRYARYENVGKAHINGLELEGSIKWQDWEVYGSATWMDAVNKTPGFRYGMRIPNRPEYEGFLRVARNNLLKNKRLSAFAEARYIGNNFYDQLQEVKQDDLLTFGVGLRYSIKDDLKLVVGVDDIFDKGPDVLFLAEGHGPDRVMWYPLQGRTYYASLIWTF